jgi:hypothetical protein
MKRVLASLVLLFACSFFGYSQNERANSMVGIWEGTATVGIWKNAPQRFLAVFTETDFIIIRMNVDSPSTVFISGKYSVDNHSVALTYLTGNDGGVMGNFPSDQAPTFVFNRTLDSFETHVDGGGKMIYKKIEQIIAGKN